MKHLNNVFKAFLRPVGIALLIIGAFQFISNSVSAQNSGSPGLSQAGYYRMHLGDFEVTALSGGTVSQNFHQLLTNAKPGEVDRLLKQSFQSEPVELSVNAYLIKNGQKTDVG